MIIIGIYIQCSKGMEIFYLISQPDFQMARKFMLSKDWTKSELFDRDAKSSLHDFSPTPQHPNTWVTMDCMLQNSNIMIMLYTW
jgi:hypothetical protein